MSEKSVFFTNSRGTKLVGLLHESKKGKDGLMLVMAHGFQTSKMSRRYSELIPSLHELQVSTLRFDFSGHGESEEKFEDITVTKAIDDLHSAIAYTRALGFSKIGLIGSSFGGYVSIYVASEDKMLSFLILKSPVSDYAVCEQKFLGEDGMRKWKEKNIYANPLTGEHAKLLYSFFQDIEKRNAYSAAEKIEMPTLLIHGTADEEVPISQSEKLAQHLQHVQFEKVEQCDHGYNNPGNAEILYEKVLRFVKYYKYDP